MLKAVKPLRAEDMALICPPGMLFSLARSPAGGGVAIFELFLAPCAGIHSTVTLLARFLGLSMSRLRNLAQ